MNTSKNFAGSNKVASAAEISNNNNRESAGADLMGLIVAGHDGADGYFSFKYGEYSIHFNRTYGYVLRGVKSYGMWCVSIYRDNVCLLDRRAINMEKIDGEYKTYKWSNKVAAWAADKIESTIADYETEQEQESIMERKYEQANEIIADAQESVNTIITDLELSIPSFDHIKTKIGAFAAKMMVQRVQEICNQCLIDCGEIFGCQMVEEDGFSPWVGNLEIWGNGHNMESLIDALDYMISGDSDMTLGLDAEDLEFINNGGCFCFDGYPMYLWQDMREFAATYYHYNYCA